MKKTLTIILSLILTIGMTAMTYAVEIPNDYIVHFSFDNLETGLTCDYGYAKPNNKAGEGAVAVIDSEGKVGGALKLDNSSEAPYWLEAYKAGGTSLLTDHEALTISYWSKSNGTGPDWAFFAVPVIDGAPYTQVYLSEHYIGVLENSSVALERYLLDGAASRDTYLNGGKIDGESWNYITVTLDEKSAVLYLNGAEIARYDECDELISQILTDNHIFYIGTATWGAVGNENYTGLIDEFYIYPYAMTAEQIADCYLSSGGDVCAVNGHTMDYTSNGDATCLKNGTMTGICTVCGYEETVREPDSALGHTFGEYTSNSDATCQMDGTKTAVCTVCGREEIVDDEGSMTSHSYKKGVCIDCGAVDAEYSPAPIWLFAIIAVIAIAVVVVIVIILTKKKK